MFDQFELHFKPDATPGQLQGIEANEIPQEPRLKILFNRYGGVSFNNGIYRVIAADTLQVAKRFIAEAFPGYAKRVIPFAYDWLGRVFVLDFAQLEDGAPSVVIFEPGCGDVLRTPCNLLAFHEQELVGYGDDALSAVFYMKWLEQGGVVPDRKQCIGYKVPMFLGGKDELENLELSNLDVYWTLLGQLINQTRHLPPGAKIRNVTIGD